MGRLTDYARNRLVLLRPQYTTVIQLQKALRNENIDISRQGIYNMLRKMDTYGSPADLARPGRIPILTLEHLDFVDRQMTINPECSARDLQALLLNEFQIHVSIDTIKRQRRKLDWVYTSTRYCQMVRRVNMAVRHAFCVQWLADEDQFQDVIFSDESSIVIGSSISKCFRRRNEPRKLVGRPKHPLKVHVWAGISARGATRICIFQGIMDTGFYLEILNDYLLPFIRDTYPNGHRFQQDNDPKHTARATTAWFETHRVNYWVTPPESPDLNPIENMWASLKWYVKKTAKPTTLEELTEAIVNFWSTVTPQMCRNFIRHLHKVMPVVIARNGGPSGY